MKEEPAASLICQKLAFLQELAPSCLPNKQKTGVAGHHRASPSAALDKSDYLFFYSYA
jgi:hypothetical protein